MGLLAKAAERLDLDAGADALQAATRAALTLPDREITLEIGTQRAIGRASRDA
jgi:hypothetical protein